MDFQDDAVVGRPPPPQSSFLLTGSVVSFLTCPKISEGLARPGSGLPAELPRKDESASERLVHLSSVFLCGVWLLHLCLADRSLCKSVPQPLLAGGASA